MLKKWLITPSPPADFMEAHPELPPIVGRLLWNRGLKTQERIDEFLNPDYGTDLHDPFLFKDMARAMEIIFAAIKNDKKIVVHGDYDADGVCAAVIIISTLKKLGAKQVEAFLPHREEGYGLNVDTVNLMKEKGVDLIITCDCGISSVEEIKLAKKLGLQIIVTDHHTIPLGLPPADAIIHPLAPGETYPDKGLSGGGVAFKLVQGLLKHHESESFSAQGGPASVWEKWMLDLVAIATVGDMVPLIGESRTLVRYGLTVLNKTRNLGLKKLLIEAGLVDEDGRPKKGSFDTHTIGFQIAPRINAAGRMDHANVALALLTADTEDEAERLAKQLNQNNSDRQKLTDKMLIKARYQIVETKQENNPILFVFDKEFTPGVLGLIAGKLKDEFYRPVLVMTETNGEISGSGRSLREFNLIAALKSKAKFFSKFGGHPQACGFTLKPGCEDEFKQFMLSEAHRALDNVDLTPQIKIDTMVDLDEINWKLFDLLAKFEPFGVGNEEPLYVAEGLTVIAVDPVGQDGKHLRILVKHNSNLARKTIAFGFGDTARHPSDWKVNLKPGDKIDLAFTVGVNEWNGNRDLQLQVEDLVKSPDDRTRQPLTPAKI